MGGRSLGRQRGHCRGRRGLPRVSIRVSASVAANVLGPLAVGRNGERDEEGRGCRVVSKVCGSSLPGVVVRR
ncbi:hypothetical protein NDU88_005779 [Pleurodeles waltl]|uniref:Uncharacterized protein n=1 Tax=Pleurodeles waltl TaxID=8319 RepID=A0AAV7WC07_PLEWA|nr:hypothetical protein NDU88_005779 [Pleurodeles waltl]